MSFCKMYIVCYSSSYNVGYRYVAIRLCSTMKIFLKKCKLENGKCANCDPLQPAPPDAEPFLFHFDSALNEMPVPSLKSVNLSLAVLSRFYCWYLTLCSDLDLSPLTLNISLYRLWRDEIVYQVFSEIEQSAAELLRFDYFTWWPRTRVTCSAMPCDNFTNFEFSQPIGSWNVTICLYWYVM